MKVVVHGVEYVMSVIPYENGIVIDVQDDVPGVYKINQALKEGCCALEKETRAMGSGLGIGLTDIIMDLYYF